MQVNIRESDKQKVRFIADLHLGHNPKWPVPIWQSRGFDSVQEHDDAIINSCNTECGPNDILIVIGDFCLNSTIEQFNSYLARINCQNIWYVNGNHNNPHEKAIYRKAMGANFGSPFQMEQYPFQYKNFWYLGDRLKLIINGQFCILDHFPLFSWEEMQHGAWMIHGHEHSAIPNHLPGGTDGKILDVGWDYFKKPLSFIEIKEIMDKKMICSVGHHRNNNL
jgi:calcineurin-like phosphoesterase family protein